MANPPRSVASRLAALSLAIGLCAACPAALALTFPRASDGRADGSIKQRSEVVRDTRIARACNALLDGRGGQVVSGGPMEAPVGNPCAAGNTRHRASAAKVQEAPVLTVGSAQADRSPDPQRSGRAAIVPRLSAGRLSATVLTTGTAILLLQSSLSTYLLILGLPFWRHVDLLPIVDAAGDNESDATVDAGDTDEELAVSHVLGAQGRQRDGAGARS